MTAPHRLGELLAGMHITVSAPPGWQTIAIYALSLNSRTCPPESLFIGLQGQTHSGAAFTEEAVRRGASAVLISERDVLPALPQEVVVIRCPHPRRALAIIAARFYDHAADHLALVGITGTNGKTTVAHLVRQLLPSAQTAYWTTSEVWTGQRRFRPSMTTPHPTDLHRFFHDATSSGHAYAVLEVSSHAVALDRVYGLSFRVGVVTNVSPDHLDFHGDFAHYVQAKRAFAESLGAEATLVINQDDPTVREFADTAKAQVIRIGFSPQADLRASNFRAQPQGSEAEIHLSAQLASRLGLAKAPSVALRWPLAGRHNLLNALAALASGLALGQDLETMCQRLALAKAPIRRMEVLQVGDYVMVNDVAMNAASYDTILASVAELHFKSLVVVNALRGNRGDEVNAESARILAEWNQRLGFAPLILTLSQSELAKLPTDVNVRPAELKAFLAAAQRGNLATEVHTELNTAIASAVARVEPKGALLLLGTFGMDSGPQLAARLLAQRAGVEVTPVTYRTIEPL